MHTGILEMDMVTSHCEHVVCVFLLAVVVMEPKYHISVISNSFFLLTAS